MKEFLIRILWTEESPYYLGIVGMCYFFNTMILMLLMPGMFGVMLEYNHLTWSVVPDYTGTLFGIAGYLECALFAFSFFTMTFRKSFLARVNKKSQ